MISCGNADALSFRFKRCSDLDAELLLLNQACLRVLEVLMANLWVSNLNIN